MHGDEAGGARGLHGEGGTLESKRVGQPPGKHTRTGPRARVRAQHPPPARASLGAVLRKEAADVYLL
jgi:hypothetical protein